MIQHTLIPGLPKLAWIAALQEDGSLSVRHGAAVECSRDWLVEGIWDGDFEQGDFHKSENFFGSGIRIDGAAVHFVPSSASVDRILYCEDGNEVLVSNSLVLLLAATGAKLDPAHHYGQEINSITKGIKHYKRELPVIDPKGRSFYQVLHESLVVTNGKASFETRTRIHDFASFEEYQGALTQALERIKKNCESPARQTKLSTFTTLSSGYDSVAVTCLVSKIGVRKCFASRRSGSIIPAWINKRMAYDDGTPVAEKLGMEVIELNNGPASAQTEPYFYALDPTHTDLVYFSASRYIEEHCAGAVIFTGYYGDRLWDRTVDPKSRNDNLVRRDTSGFRISEARLNSGFINAPVPFMFARSAKSIYEISVAPEMAPWTLHNDYDRPIPRRIAETAGIDRRSFGMLKRGMANRPSYPSNTQLRKQFFAFLRLKNDLSPMMLRVSRPARILAERIGVFSSYARYAWASKTLSPPLMTFTVVKTKQRDDDLPKLLFQWSIELLTKRTKAVLDGWRMSGLGVVWLFASFPLSALDTLALILI